MDFIFQPIHIIRRYRSVKRDLKKIRQAQPTIGISRFELRQLR